MRRARCIDSKAYDFRLAGSPHRYSDYETGDRIDHVDGMTVQEAEHQIATRLYQNTARVHFDQYTQSKSQLGRRLIYGGHVISLARSLSFNGLANAFHIAAINGGRHVAPLFGGETVFAWSEVLEKAELPGRTDVGALRLRLDRDEGSALLPTSPTSRARTTSAASSSISTIGRSSRADAGARGFLPGGFLPAAALPESCCAAAPSEASAEDGMIQIRHCTQRPASASRKGPKMGLFFHG